MSRPVIPPLPPSQSPRQSQQTAEVLRRRLVSAEEDTRNILEQLGNLGHTAHFNLPTRQEYGPADGDRDRRATAGSANMDLPTLPSDSQVAESLPGSSALPQDVLISRVCRLESMIQTLKLSLANVSGGFGHSGSRSDKKKLHAEIEEKVNQIQQELGSEVVRLKRQMATLQEELTLESEARQRVKEESEKLKEALEIATQARAEATVSADDLNTTKQKLIRRISELKEEVARETSLRASLEVSHNTLMARVQETEALIEKERKEVQNSTTNMARLKQEVARLKEELNGESSRRQMAEEACQRLIAEKEKAQASYETAQSESKMASSELARLQSQYSNLIHQFEGTQALMDQQKTQAKDVEVERDRLKQVAEKAAEDQGRLQALEKHLTESESNHRAVREALEEEVAKMKKTITDLTAQNTSLQKTITKLEGELEASQKALSSREQNFSAAATELESELNTVRRQLQSLEAEKESVQKGKENLLEEVNQTVDSLMAERSRLQGELERCRAEIEGLQGKCRQTETENMQLMERIGSFEHQQMSQRKVESTLKEMLEQKSKLAYENGKLQSQVTQLKTDLAAAQMESGDVAQLKKMNEALQAKLTQLQKETGEYKMATQRLEGQMRHTSDLLEQKQHELTLTQARREELERELGKVLGRVEVLEGREKQKTHQHHKNMEDAKSVNREIASTLEAVMSSHTQLQGLVENLQAELGRRDTEIGRLKSLRIKEQDDMKLEIKRLEETAAGLRAELKREQDRTGRRTNRDVAELKKQNSNLSTRNGELVATNTELRQRVGEMDKMISELQQKLASQKHKTEHMHKAKKHVEENLQRMKQMREDIDELERLRDEYTQKNREQAETITSFMQQMASLQEEVQSLAAAQVNTGRLLQMKEEALEKERKLREDTKKKYSESRKREEVASKHKYSTDEKLKEAQNESVEISKNLMEAHEWFKGKFAKLQQELSDSKAVQAKLERENQDQRQKLLSEKSHAHEAAQRAKEMIKASRETISRLADYTEQADSDTKQQLAELRAEVAREKAHSKMQWSKVHP